MRTVLIIAAAGAIAIAGFAMAQGPRAPAEPGARTPQAQVEEQQAQRMVRRAAQQQSHRVEGMAKAQERAPAEQQEHRQERQALQQQLHREQVEAIATMTREQTMLRKAECDAASDATATMTRTQRGPQARW